jgi:hypothetical protein
MHRLLVVQLGQNASDKFRVVADSGNPAVSEDDPVSIEEAGGSGWGELNSPAGFKSRFASIPCRGVVSELGYWRVGKTGEVLEYDFADLGVSERKVIVGGELHLEYDGRRYVARPGDSIMFLLDPHDRVGGTLRPFLVRFLAEHECTAVYTEYALT